MDWFVIKMLVWLVYILIAISAPEQQILGYVHICTAIKYIKPNVSSLLPAASCHWNVLSNGLSETDVI